MRLAFGFLDKVGRRVTPSMLLAALVLGGCSDPTSRPNELRVFAASSLTEAFEELANHFESTTPGTEVELALAGSQVLRLQIEQGAPADVVASADPRHMEAMVAAGRVRDPCLFAHNELVVIVPRANPADVRSLADLSRADRLVIGSENVPVGHYTREILIRADNRFGSGFHAAVLGRVVSEETNVRLVRAKVELGEADAAVVYRTDAAASDGVRSIPIPAELNVRADYWIGVVAGSSNPRLADRWLDMMVSEAGQAILRKHGFVVE